MTRFAIDALTAVLGAELARAAEGTVPVAPFEALLD